MERKQIIQPLNDRPRVQPISEVKSREVTSLNKHYSPEQTFSNLSFPKLQHYPERHFLDSPQTVIHQPEDNHPDNV